MRIKICVFSVVKVIIFKFLTKKRLLLHVKNNSMSNNNSAFLFSLPPRRPVPAQCPRRASGCYSVSYPKTPEYRTQQFFLSCNTIRLRITFFIHYSLLSVLCFQLRRGAYRKSQMGKLKEELSQRHRGTKNTKLSLGIF